MSLRRTKYTVPGAEPTAQLRPALVSRSTSAGEAAVEVGMKMKMMSHSKTNHTKPSKPKYMRIKRVQLTSGLWLKDGMQFIEGKVEITRKKDGGLHAMRFDKGSMGNVTVDGMPHSVTHANLFPIEPTKEMIFNVVFYGEGDQGQTPVIATLRVALIPQSLNEVEVHLLSIKGMPMLGISSGVKVDDSLTWAALALVTAYSYDDNVFYDLKDSGLESMFMMM